LFPECSEGICGFFFDGVFFGACGFEDRLKEIGFILVYGTELVLEAVGLVGAINGK
jgi:hypothetical protein